MAGRSDIRAGRAFVELFVNENKLVKGLQNAAERMKSFGRGIRNIGLGMTAAGAAITAPFVAAVGHFISFGDELDKMSKRTGVAATALAEFRFAFQQSGGDLQTFEKSLRRMQKTLFDMATGTSEADDAMEKLGLNYADFAGKSPEDQFQLIADRIADVEDATTRSGIAQEIFGARSGTATMVAIENLRELREEARREGLIPTEEAIANAAKVSDAFNIVKQKVLASLFDVGASMADSLLRAVDLIKPILSAIQSWVKDNGKLLVTIAAIGAALTAAGTVLAATGFAIMGIGSALGLVASVLSVVLSPIGLLIGGLFAAGAAFVHFTQAGKNAASAIGEAFGGALSFVKEVFGGIVDAIMGGDLELAGTIAVTGFQVAMLRGFEFLATSIGGIWGDLIGTIGSQLLGGDFAGAWDTAVEAMSAVWVQFVTHIQEVFFNVVAAIAKGITKLKGAITSAIDALNRAEAQADFDRTEEKLQAQRTAIVNQISQLEQQAQSRVGITPGEAMTEEQFAKVEAAYTDEERARWEKLAAAREALNQPTLDAVAKLNVANKALMDAEDDENDLLAGIEAQRVENIEGLQAKREKAMSDLAEATAGGSDKASSLADERQSELDRIIAEAAKRREEAEAKREAASKPKQQGEGFAGAAQRSVAVSFSAAALQGLSGRGPIEERIAKANEENGKRLDKLVAISEKQLMTARDGAAAVVS